MADRLAIIGLAQQTSANIAAIAVELIPIKRAHLLSRAETYVAHIDISDPAFASDTRYWPRAFVIPMIKYLLERADSIITPIAVADEIRENVAVVIGDDEAQVQLCFKYGGSDILVLPCVRSLCS